MTDSSTERDAHKAKTGSPLDAALLLEAAPNGWVIVDLDGTILMVNQLAERLFGYSRSELIGSNVDMLVPNQVRQQHLSHRDSYAANPTTRPMNLGLDVTGRRKDGSEFPVEIALSPVVSDGRTYVIAVIQDIAGRINLQDERNILALELEMERERQRIGMDLHDGIMQEIYATGLTLELALEDLGENNRDASASIERSINQLHQVIRNIRSYIFDLRPREFSGDLSEALDNLAKEFGQNSLIDTKTDIPDYLAYLDPAKAIGIYHIAHEALSNIHKHAQAKHVRISITEYDQSLVVEIADDGRGFDSSASISQQHRGLRNMSSRARSIDGYLDVSSFPNKGTKIRIEVPL